MARQAAGALLLALMIAGGGAAQAQGGVASQIDDARKRVVAARLNGYATLRRDGALPDEQMAKLNDLIKEALDVWSMCVNAEVDRQAGTVLPNDAVIDAATATCSRDRVEIIAWFDFIGQAHKNPVPADFLANYLKEQDAMMRANALVRLKARRAS